MTYLFPIANGTELGVVSAGTNITITNGVISASGSGSSTVGTWTPTIAVSSSGTITLLINAARYSKSGQQVICYFDVTVVTYTGGNPTNILTLNGLPFTSIVSTGIVGSLIITYFEGLNTNQTYITGTVAGSSTSVLLWDQHQQADTQRLTYADVQLIPTPTRLVGTITYLSAS
jgi:hypothetical protein